MNARPLPGIILAAGASRRMGLPKLLLKLDGRSLFGRCLDTALQAGLNPLIVVLSSDSAPELAEEVLHAAYQQDFQGGPSVSLCLAEKAALGQAESLKAGLGKLLADCPQAPACLVMLADQPLLGPDLLRELTAAFWREDKSVAPQHQGRRGNPVILHRDLFPEVMNIQGDQGARSLLARHPLHLLPCADAACLLDVDTPEDLAFLRARI